MSGLVRKKFPYRWKNWKPVLSVPQHHLKTIDFFGAVIGSDRYRTGIYFWLTTYRAMNVGAAAPATDSGQSWTVIYT